MPVVPSTRMSLRARFALQGKKAVVKYFETLNQQNNAPIENEPDEITQEFIALASAPTPKSIHKNTTRQKATQG